MRITGLRVSEGGSDAEPGLRRVIDAHGGRLPEDISVIFVNTGVERPETLEFVDVCAHAWAVRNHRPERWKAGRGGAAQYSARSSTAWPRFGTSTVRS